MTARIPTLFYFRSGYQLGGVLSGIVGPQQLWRAGDRALVRVKDDQPGIKVYMRYGDSPDPVVYVVDDDLDLREGLKALFDSVSLRCEVFSSATQFLTTKMPEEVSCLVLDVRLPELSGLDVQALLAEAEISIPIVFITGHGDIPMAVKAMRAGAVSFLTKPFREQDLLDAIRDALQRDSHRRQREDQIRDLRSRFNALTDREKETVALITAGLMNKQAAGELGVSEVTVKVHRHNIMKKLGARSLADLVRMADTLGVRRKKPNGRVISLARESDATKAV